MPHIKIKHDDIITTETWLEILDLALKLDFSQSWKVPPIQSWFACVLAFDWMFGKRINEILTLKRKHITKEKGLVKVLFYVGKKKTKTASIEFLPFQKAKTSKHKAYPYIRSYLQEFDKQGGTPEDYLFFAATNPRTRKVNTTFTNGKGETETRNYTYTDNGGHIYEENCRYYLNKINEQLPEGKRIYFHYGRHTIGIKMARQGRSVWEIADVLDDSERAAIAYTKKAGGYSQRWTRETE